MQNRRRHSLILGLISIVVVGLVLAAVAGSVPSLASKPLSSALLSLSHPPIHTADELKDQGRFFGLRQGLQFGVPKDAYAKAVEQRRAMERAARAGLSADQLGAATASSWKFIGPQPIVKEQANFGGMLFGSGFNATGRVAAIAVDPSGNVYVGTATGGVWLSTDKGAHFKWISAALPTQSIGSISIDNSNGAGPIVYVGTGEGNNPFGGDSYYGQGLWRTSDMGATWTQIEGPPGGKFFTNGAYQTFTTLSIPCLYLFAGTGFAFSTTKGSADWLEGLSNTGSIYESLRAGDTGTWHRTFGQPFTSGGPVRTLIIGAAGSPESPEMFSAIDLNGIFEAAFTCGAGQPLSPWSNVSIPSSSFGRASLAVGGPVPFQEDIYAMVGAANTVSGIKTYGSNYAGFFSSTDGGADWSRLTVPCAETTNGGTSWHTSPCGDNGPPATTVTLDGTAVSGANNQPPVSSQAFYDQTLIVSPADHKTLYFGGLGVYSSTDGKTWKFLAANGQTHTDQHALAFDTTDSTRLYVGNDGGLFVLDTGSGTFTELNDTISAVQIYGIGPHPTDNSKLLAGTQDNGTILYTGKLGWTSADTGDGGSALFDHNNPAFAYHDYGGSGCPSIVTSMDGGVTWPVANFQKQTTALCTALANNPDYTNGDPGGTFTAPITNDREVALRVLIGANSIYVSEDGMFTWSPMSPPLASCVGSGCAVTDIEFDPFDDSHAWAITAQATFLGGSTFPFTVWNSNHADLDTEADTNWVEVDGTLPFNASDTQATSIAPDPFDNQTAYLSLSGFTAVTGIGHIYKTTRLRQDLGGKRLRTAGHSSRQTFG